MQVIVDPEYFELTRNENEPNSKQVGGEYNPFTGKRCPTTSMDNIKKLLSLPKEERKKMLLGLSNNSSYN